jgi:ppGpp synthetase/RelA/SpoT-type nucleotidyltranferase
VEDLAPEELEMLSDAVDVVSEYRASFSRPLLSVRMSVASFANTCGYGDSAFVAQRLKRLPRIITKLDRMRSMNITTMGDIGGCRVVLPDLEAVHTVQAHVLRRWNGRIRRHDDYIANPKGDGYRAVHVETVRAETGESNYRFAPRASTGGQIRSRVLVGPTT